MATEIKPGMMIARNFTVRGVHHPTIKVEMKHPVMDATVVELDAAYENTSWLMFYTFAQSAPGMQDWEPFVFDHPPLANIRVHGDWSPAGFDGPCRCIKYKARTTRNDPIVITQMMAATDNTLVSAKLTWLGMLGMRKLNVAFKPGMEMRTEELLMAGLELV